MKKIYAIVGKSGVGKTTLVNELLKRHPDWKAVESYTTRPPRHEGETGHVFVTPDEMMRLRIDQPMVTYAEYDGYAYGATTEMIDEADLYVIEPSGVESMKKLYRGIKGIEGLYITAPDDLRRKRMRERGDSDEAIKRRMQDDFGAFICLNCCPNIELQYTVEWAEDVIRYSEMMEPTVRIYQIDPDLDFARVKFADSGFLRKWQNTEQPEINFDIYRNVWQGDLGFDVTLDQIFRKFNADDRPNRFGMHSLSVSDIVEVLHNPDRSKNGLWFCDSFGWRKLSQGCFML
ncbi:MAG: hypothetical protein IJI27_05310 [Oscillospiraceae bacterium]|nr:hypothetical protein [Oscillospiraceae bacterium]